MSGSLQTSRSSFEKSIDLNKNPKLIMLIYFFRLCCRLVENEFFYASLHAQPTQQSQILHTEMRPANNTLVTKQEEPSEVEEINFSEFTTFLEVVESDYQNSGRALRTALDKFKDRNNAAKFKSISRLTSFLYDLNRDLDPMVRVKSDANIRVQV
ncbi:hypothetical protein RclHR1_00670025 [Rhizophagus clarus]|uniref:Uncharacterized protein n=1 Tax=Rhizophagus clarus TaxID=94130 RepID=A0A2Z6RZ99_9GLOM|nr:hypothetical protein RclHR1_00670025 [Rhizophagus clarus]